MTTSFARVVMAGAGLTAWATPALMGVNACTIATNEVIDFTARASGVVEAVARFVPS